VVTICSPIDKKMCKGPQMERTLWQCIIAHHLFRLQLLKTKK